MYFKDNQNNPYEGKKEIFEKKLGVVLTEITKEEFEQIVTAKNTPTQEQVIAQQLQEKKNYLASTDWIANKYHDVVTVGGDMSKAEFTAKYQDIYTARESARAFINANEVI